MQNTELTHSLNETAVKRNIRDITQNTLCAQTSRYTLIYINKVTLKYVPMTLLSSSPFVCLLLQIQKVQNRIQIKSYVYREADI